jgi:hypothetical protein
VLADAMVVSRNEPTESILPGNECEEKTWYMDRIATQVSSRLATKRWAGFLGGTFVRETSR